MNVLKFMLIASLAVLAAAEVRTGKITSHEGFHYMGKFCYDWTPLPPPGVYDGSTMTLSVKITSPSDRIPENMRLYVFDDQANSWPAVYGKDISCAAKIAKSRNSTSIDFGQYGDWQMPLARIHEHIRPRFWYIVAANCLGFEDLQFEIKFINQGGDWKKEFGVNEQGLNTLYLVYFVLYLVGMIIHMYALRNMWQADALHPIVKLLASTIILQFGSITCGVIHYCSYVGNGVGVPPVNALKEVLNIASRLTFTLLMILLAQGWTISTDRLENRGKIFTLIGVFIVAYMGLIFYDVLYRDPASTLYVYESLPGILLVGMDLLTAAWFITAIHTTHSNEEDPEKAHLYEMIGFGFTLWFIALPATVGVASMLDPWVREVTVTAISLTISTVAYASLAIMLWPGRAEKYFRITTPDVMKSTTHDDDL